MTSLADIQALASSGDFSGALASSLQFDSTDLQEKLEARCVTNWCLSRLGHTEAAYAGAIAVLADARVQFGAGHRVALAAANDAARFASRADDLDFAVNTGEFVTARRSAILGNAHPKTLTARANLARYKWMEHRTGTLNEVERLLATWDLIDPDRVDPAHLSALLLYAEVLLELAASAAKDVLAQYVQVLGANHPDTVRAREVLQQRTVPR